MYVSRRNPLKMIKCTTVHLNYENVLQSATPSLHYYYMILHVHCGKSVIFQFYYEQFWSTVHARTHKHKHKERECGREKEKVHEYKRYAFWYMLRILWIEFEILEVFSFRKDLMYKTIPHIIIIRLYKSINMLTALLITKCRKTIISVMCVWVFV